MSEVVTINPNVLGGTPVFKGTRVPIEVLFDYIKCGHSVEYFLEDFPGVTRGQIDRLLDDTMARTTELRVAS